MPRYGRFAILSRIRAWPACLLLGLAGCGPPSGPMPPGPTFAVPRKVIQPPHYAADSPFSPGVLAGDTLYLAGQVGRDPQTGEVPDSAAEQTRAAMQRVGGILAAAGLEYGHLVKCHVFLDDMDHYGPMNAAYAAFFPDDYYPARTTVEIAGLAGGFRVEVSCIAFRDKSRIRVVRPPQESLPAAMGPYSPGVLAGESLYLSGQGGYDPATRRLPDSIAAQTAQALDNLKRVISAAGLSEQDVVYANVYFAGCRRDAGDRAFFTAFPDGADFPRSLICVPRLPGELAVEINLFVEPEGGQTVYLAARSAAEAGGGIALQMSAALEKLGADLRQAGLGFEHVVNAHVYLRNVDDFQGMNGVFREVFPDAPPARTTVATLQPEQENPVLVEVALIAVR